MAVMVSVVIHAMIPVMIAHQVRHTDLVATTKAFTIRFPLNARYARMTELIAIVHVWPAVIVEVLSCAFDSIVEALPLGLMQILWRHIPATAILRKSRRRLRCGEGGELESAQSRDSEEKDKCRGYQSIESHGLYLLFCRGLQGNQVARHGNGTGPESRGDGHCCSDADLWEAVA